MRTLKHTHTHTLKCTREVIARQVMYNGSVVNKRYCRWQPSLLVEFVFGCLCCCIPPHCHIIIIWTVIWTRCSPWHLLIPLLLPFPKRDNMTTFCTEIKRLIQAEHKLMIMLSSLYNEMREVIKILSLWTVDDDEINHLHLLDLQVTYFHLLCNTQYITYPVILWKVTFDQLLIYLINISNHNLIRDKILRSLWM